MLEQERTNRSLRGTTSLPRTQREEMLNINPMEHSSRSKEGRLDADSEQIGEPYGLRHGRLSFLVFAPCVLPFETPTLVQLCRLFDHPPNEGVVFFQHCLFTYFDLPHDSLPAPMLELAPNTQGLVSYRLFAFQIFRDSPSPLRGICSTTHFWCMNTLNYLLIFLDGPF
jgi:hypothetical protein